VGKAKGGELEFTLEGGHLLNELFQHLALHILVTDLSLLNPTKLYIYIQYIYIRKERKEEEKRGPEKFSKREMKRKERKRIGYVRNALMTTMNSKMVHFL